MSYNRRTLSPDSPYAILAAVLLFLSAGILVIDFARSFQTVGTKEVVFRFLLPGLGCVMLGGAYLTRKNSLIPTILPMLFGTAAFALRTLDRPQWQCILSCVFYGLFALAYILTVTGVLGSRNWLLGLSGFPFLFHLLVEDLLLGNFDGFAAFLPELAVLLPMTAFFAVAWGMRRGRLYS